MPDHAVPATLPAQFGPYRIMGRLGGGGMGTVYRAIDSRLNRKVALKVCHLADKSTALKRFQREAQAAAALRHPNLCPIYESDVIDGIPYFTMALVDGPTLDQWLERRGGLTQREAVLLTRKLALALQYAHDNRVIHRDLKPTNVALDGAEPVILDFGLARQDGTDDSRLTKAGTILGTPSYMSPEQVRGDMTTGPLTDIYSLGVILYELLTGQLPFEGPTMAVLALIMVQEPSAPRTIRAEVDARVEAICVKAMAKDPAKRWPSMKAFADALADAAKALPKEGSSRVRPSRASSAESSVKMGSKSGATRATQEAAVPSGDPTGPLPAHLPSPSGASASPEEERFRHLGLVTRMRQLRDAQKLVSRLQKSYRKEVAITMFLAACIWLATGVVVGGLFTALFQPDSHDPMSVDEPSE